MPPAESLIPDGDPYGIEFLSGSTIANTQTGSQRADCGSVMRFAFGSTATGPASILAFIRCLLAMSINWICGIVLNVEVK
jgi:hypothetical protein